MLILKGNRGKSVVVHELIRTTQSRCMVYHNQALPFQSIYIDSTETDFAGLRECIMEYMEKNLVSLDWFIVYTNEDEDNLSDFIIWLEQNKSKFECKDIILTCK